MTIKKYPKNANILLSPFFNSSEFDCSCNNCTETYIDDLLIEKLDKLRGVVSEPIHITSGYRCPTHNAKIGGAPNSSHTSGMAADITCVNIDRLYTHSCVFFEAVGDGRKKGFVHVDTRTGKMRRWNY